MKDVHNRMPAMVFEKTYCPLCYSDTGLSHRLKTRAFECEECGHTESTLPPAHTDTDTVPVLRMLLRQAQ